MQMQFNGLLERTKNMRNSILMLLSMIKTLAMIWRSHQDDVQDDVLITTTTCLKRFSPNSTHFSAGRLYDNQLLCTRNHGNRNSAGITEGEAANSLDHPSISFNQLELVRGCPNHFSWQSSTPLAHSAEVDTGYDIWIFMRHDGNTVFYWLGIM